MNKRPSKMGIFHNTKLIMYRGEVTGMYEVDHERLIQHIELICRGIFYSIFGEPWQHDIQIALPFTFPSGPNHSNEYSRVMREVVKAGRIFLEDENRIGDNPEVFYYQSRLKEDGPGIIFRLVFYEGIEIFASFDPELNTLKSA